MFTEYYEDNSADYKIGVHQIQFLDVIGFDKSWIRIWPYIQTQFQVQISMQSYNSYIAILTLINTVLSISSLSAVIGWVTSIWRV